MTKTITYCDYKKAEKAASELDLHISKAVRRYCRQNGEIELLNARKVIKLVKPRPENSHKGSFGRLVMIAGSDRYPGAAQITALAALRSGVGLISVATTRLAAQALSVSVKEATLLPLPSGSDGFLCPESTSLNELAELISKADALLIGPGLGTADSCFKILEAALETANCPIILDADGINLVSGRIELLRKAKTDLILTPHPAELARLCGAPLKDVIADRLSCAKKISDELGCTVVAKSAGTFIVGGGRCYLSVMGNNGLAKGGSGDLLAGLISSFAAQGHDPILASKLGVCVQGLACERVSAKLGRRGMLASDIISCLPMLFK